MSYADEMDKQQIYVSEKLAVCLRRDAELFEFFHKDGQRLNFNRFLTSLLVGYADSYTQEQEEMRASLQGILEKYHPGAKSNPEVAGKLIAELSHPEAKQSEKSTVRLSLKPTAASVQILSDM